MKFTKQTFENINVLLDGHEFVGCTFNKCHMQFGGVMVCGLDSNRFADCTWEFVGPAAKTISFMAALYANPGGAKTMVENTLNNIRTGKIAAPKH